MFVNNPEIDEILEISDCIATMPNPETCSESLVNAKSEAISDTWSRAKSFRRHGMRNDLVHIAFKKRLSLIKEAKTVAEVKEIMREPRPYYDGGEFKTGPLGVPEEEMMLWSIASLKAPPSEAAFKRYMDLFIQIFGFDPSDPRNCPDKIRLEVDDDVAVSGN